MLFNVLTSIGMAATVSLGFAGYSAANLDRHDAELKERILTKADIDHLTSRLSAVEKKVDQLLYDPPLREPQTKNIPH